MDRGLLMLGRVGLAAGAAIAAACAAGALAGSAHATSSIFAPTYGTGPQQIVIDSAGYLYTSDFASNVVSRITPLGQTEALGATGTNPYGIAIDSSGNVYATNYGAAPPTVTKVSPDGTSNVTWAATGNGPYGIAIDSTGNLYVSNQNAASITKITPDGSSNPLFASTGAGPSGIAIDKNGNLYVANQTAGTVTKVAPDGTPAGAPWPVAVGAGPDGIAVDSGGNVYTANSGSNDVSKIAPDGTVVATWPAGTTPRNLRLDTAGNLYVSNFGSATVTRINTSTGASSIAGVTGTGPLGMILDSRGNLYVANSGSSNITRISSGQVAPAPPRTPSQPTAAAGALSASVTVPANPASAIYGTPTSYTVTAVQDSAKGCTVVPPATSCEVAGLTAGVSYTFTARANLDAWQTSASEPSNAVVPAAAPSPDPGPGPGPDPGPSPAPSNSYKLSRASIVGRTIRTTITVKAPGRIVQRGNRVARAGWSLACSTTRKVSRAGTYTLVCPVDSEVRAAQYRGPVKVLLKTTFTPTGGEPKTLPRAALLPRLTPRGPAFTGRAHQARR